MSEVWQYTPLLWIVLWGSNSILKCMQIKNRSNGGGTQSASQVDALCLVVFQIHQILLRFTLNTSVKVCRSQGFQRFMDHINTPSVFLCLMLPIIPKHRCQEGQTKLGPDVVRGTRKWEWERVAPHICGGLNTFAGFYRPTLFSFGGTTEIF